MKKYLMIAALSMSLQGSGIAQNIVGLTAKDRVSSLNDKMARDLQLNNYQQSKLNQINDEVISKIAELEKKFKNDPVAQEKACRGACVQRDEKLKNVLSTDQYTRYIHSREDFFQYDRNFANATTSITLDSKVTAQRD